MPVLPVILTRVPFLFCTHISAWIIYHLSQKDRQWKLFCIVLMRILPLLFHCSSESIQPNVPFQTFPPFFLNFTFFCNWTSYLRDLFASNLLNSMSMLAAVFYQKGNSVVNKLAILLCLHIAFNSVNGF